MSLRPRDTTESELPSQAAGGGAGERDHRLSMSERLEQVHQLCAQMAKLAPIRRQRSG